MYLNKLTNKSHISYLSRALWIRLRHADNVMENRNALAYLCISIRCSASQNQSDRKGERASAEKVKCKLHLSGQNSGLPPDSSCLVCDVVCQPPRRRLFPPNVEEDNIFPSAIWLCSHVTWDKERILTRHQSPILSIVHLNCACKCPECSVNTLLLVNVDFIPTYNVKSCYQKPVQ